MEQMPAFWRRRPHNSLSGLVSELIGYDERGIAMAGAVEPASLFVPLIINFGTRFEIGLGRRPGPDDAIGSFAAGLFAGPVKMNSDGGAQCVQINFTPVGGRLFFGLPLKELADRTIPLDDLGDAGVNALARRLGDMPDWERRLHLAEQFVVGRLAHATALDPHLLWAYRRIEQRRGDLRMGHLLDELGWSRRRLAARCSHEFGLTPKAIARIARFNAAGAMAFGPGKPDWADIAAACGYADQAHLSREFNALAGVTPGQFMA